DLFESGAQPLATFAIEVADRAAQPVHRFDQFRLLTRTRAMLVLDPSQFLGRDQIDGADPLAVGDHAVHGRRFLARTGDAVGIESEAARQHRRWALETLA